MQDIQDIMEDQQLDEDEGQSIQEGVKPVKGSTARTGAHAQRGRRGLLSRKEMEDFIRLVQGKEANGEEIDFKLAADLVNILMFEL